MANNFVLDLNHMESFTQGDGPIVVVDDDPAQIIIFEECYEESGRKNELICVLGGDEFLTLAEEIRHKRKAMPELVLLDVNMPKKNGFEVLKAIRGAEELREMPVIMFTSSDSEVDQERSRELRADGFMSKPTSVVDYVRFFKLV